MNHPLWKRTCFLISNLFAIGIFFLILILDKRLIAIQNQSSRPRWCAFWRNFRKILQEKFSKINRKHSLSQRARVDFREDWNLYIDIGIFYEHYEGSSQHMFFFHSKSGFKYYECTRCKTLIWIFIFFYM